MYSVTPQACCLGMTFLHSQKYIQQGKIFYTEKMGKREHEYEGIFVSF